MNEPIYVYVVRVWKHCLPLMKHVWINYSLSRSLITYFRNAFSSTDCIQGLEIHFEDFSAQLQISNHRVLWEDLKILLESKQTRKL